MHFGFDYTFENLLQPLQPRSLAVRGGRTYGDRGCSRCNVFFKTKSYLHVFTYSRCFIFHNSHVLWARHFNLLPGTQSDHPRGRHGRYCRHLGLRACLWKSGCHQDSIAAADVSQLLQLAWHHPAQPWRRPRLCQHSLERVACVRLPILFGIL